MSTAYLTPFPTRQCMDYNGFPLAGGRVYSYLAGTNTAAPTYTDASGLVENANPVLLDSAGRAAIFIPAGVAYKFIIDDEHDVQVDEQDGVMIPALSSPPAPDTVPTGCVVFRGKSGSLTGYLPCDGAAVSRAVYAALFAVLGTTWGSGDGSTTFNVPDLRDRPSIGAGSTHAVGTVTATVLKSTELPSTITYTNVPALQALIKT